MDTHMDMQLPTHLSYPLNSLSFNETDRQRKFLFVTKKNKDNLIHDFSCGAGYA